MKKTEQDNQKDVINFPHSRTRPKGSKEGFKELGNSTQADKIDKDQANLKGHWCSRCEGIWYGVNGECECPQCGNRNG